MSYIRDVGSIIAPATATLAKGCTAPPAPATPQEEHTETRADERFDR